MQTISKSSFLKQADQRPIPAQYHGIGGLFVLQQERGKKKSM